MSRNPPSRKRRAVRNQVIWNAVAEGITDVDTIRQRLAAEGVTEITDEMIEYRLNKFLRRHEEETLPRVYADACRMPGLVGIGVHCDEPKIEFKRHTRKGMTNNAAECEAILDAVRLGSRSGLDRFLVCSDSQLALCWTDGRYAQRSATAQKYTPKMRRALERANARLIWVPGAQNLADRLSRLAIGIDPSLPPLERVKQAKIEALGFKDFAELKVGRDEFSSLRLPKLRELVSPDDARIVTGEFDDDSDIARCLRWILRGLPVEKAIKKVRTDLEITERVKERRRRRQFVGEEF